MPDFAVDTSIYPKLDPPGAAIDRIGKVIDVQRGQQALQSGAISIDKQKFDLANARYGEFVKTLTALRNDPNLNEDKLRNWAQTNVKLGLMPSEMAGQFINQLPPTQGLNSDQARQALIGNIDTNLTHAATVKEALDYHMGNQQTMDTGNSIQPVAVSPKFGIRSTGLPIQKYPPPGTTGVDNSNNPAFQPPNPSAVAMPPAAPGANLPMAGKPLSIAPPAGNPPPMAQPAPAPQPHTPAPQSFAPAPPVNFEEGKKAYNDDQALSTQKLTAIKPALLALKYIPALRSGPGTELWNQAIAGLKANNIIKIDAKDDPTAIYQEVNKYLNDYLSRRGGATDAAREQLMKSSPNIDMQINPALLKLTQTAVAQDRIEAARANAFRGSKSDYTKLEDRNDYENYNKHRSTFPAEMDERAFNVDTLTPEQKQDLTKEIQNMKPAERKRFARSLRAYKMTGVGPNE